MAVPSDPSAAAYEQAFARAPIGMALIGLDGRFRDVNEVLCSYAGRRREELLGSSFELVTHPDDLDEDLELAGEVVRGERELFVRDRRYVRPDGSIRWVEVSGSLIRDDAGRPLHFVFHVHDITERRRAERLKEEFLATISHELRTPLTSIKGYAELLAEEAELSPGSRRKAVTAIERNAERLRRLVEDVQFIAQARAQTLSMSRAEVQLDRLVLECVEWAAPRGSALGLALSVDAEPLTLPSADADRLGQAIDHLLSNALHYTPPGGRVDVRLVRDGDSAVVEVADTGVGLAEEDAAHLFDHFFRASAAVDGAVPGIGLGLSIVKAITDLHGGDVEVQSAPGAGTAVRLRLPQATAAALTSP
jgi:PAS domain S-box-containing protein